MPANLPDNDGGYYAIKGFEFQIDKAIFEILESTNENTLFSIERIQDIDSDSFVMQVKYKETCKFLPSKIKEPVIQLINEYKNNTNKTYHLYAYFNDLKGYTTFVDSNKKISIENLNKILGNKKGTFTDNIKNGFINKFILDFAPEFQEQFNNVIVKLQTIRNISNFDEAVFYYSNITDFLRKLVINHTNPNDRKCSRKQIFDYISNGKKLIFNSAYKEYKGEKLYFDYLKTKFIKLQKNQDNFIVLDDVTIDSSLTIENLIINIVEKYFKKAQCDIKPLTFIVSDRYSINLKKALIKNEILFNDGYEHIEFNSNIFFDNPIINKKQLSNGRATENLAKISFKLRILSEIKFLEISDWKLKPQIIYYFDADICDKFINNSFLKIDKLNTKQINDLF